MVRSKVNEPDIVRDWDAFGRVEHAIALMAGRARVWLAGFGQVLGAWHFRCSSQAHDLEGHKPKVDGLTLAAIIQRITLPRSRSSPSPPPSRAATSRAETLRKPQPNRRNPGLLVSAAPRHQQQGWSTSYQAGSSRYVNLSFNAKNLSQFRCSSSKFTVRRKQLRL